MRVTHLIDILNMEEFWCLNQLTHASNYNEQKVNSVVMGEVPDLDRFIEENTVVVTTGMVFKDKEDRMFDYLQRLKKAKVAAIGFKVGRFFNEVSPNLIQYCQQLDLTLLEIPKEVILIRLVSRIQDVISGKDDIATAFSSQRQFSKLLRKGISIDQLLKEYSKLLTTPLVLLNSFFQIEELHGITTESVIDLNLIATVKEGFERNKLDQLLETEDNSMQISVIPLNVYINYDYYLVIIEPDDIPYPISAITLELMASNLTFALYKEIEVGKIQSFDSFDYFMKLIENKEIDETQLSYYGYLEEKYYRVILVDIATSLQERTPNQRSEDSLLLNHWLMYHQEEYFPQANILHDYLEQHNIILLQTQLHNLPEKLESIASAIKKDLNLAITFTVGNGYTHLRDIHYSYDQALGLLEGVKNRPYSIAYYMQEETIANLFNEIDHRFIESYCLSILNSLAYPINKGDQDLRETLEVYLENRYEIKATSEKLFIHRNTVVYRLNKCRDILGEKLEKPEHLLDLLLALRLSRFD